MDPKSGVFEVPITGVYFFTLHVCTHDLKKALLSIRKNGVTELASLYDQNHSDNHKVTNDKSNNDFSVISDIKLVKIIKIQPFPKIYFFRIRWQATR